MKKEIENISISDIYYYEKMCETVIDKLINDINCEKESTLSTYHPNRDYTETENEKQFKKFTKIHNNLIEKAKEKLLDLGWEN